MKADKISYLQLQCHENVTAWRSSGIVHLHAFKLRGIVEWLIEKALLEQTEQRTSRLEDLPHEVDLRSEKRVVEPVVNHRMSGGLSVFPNTAERAGSTLHSIRGTGICATIRRASRWFPSEFSHSTHPGVL